MLHDGAATFAASTFFSPTPPDLLARALASAGLTSHAFGMTINLLVASTGGKNVLVDTGVGRDVGGGEGRLVERLDSLGLAPADIDVVAITHGHWDHIGGLTDGDGEPRFPNARVLMAQDEWDYWTADESLARADPMLAEWARRHLPPIADQIEAVSPGSEVMPGLRAIDASGHTVGQLAYLFESGGNRLLHIGDAAHHTMQVSFPDVVADGDLEPAVTVAALRSLLASVADGDGLLMGAHFAFPGVGRVSTAGDAWAWQPL